jgi:hypothetical protein
MKTLLAGFRALGNVIESAEDVAKALQAMREEIPDDQWERLTDANPALDRLVSACIDLEASLEQ